MGVHRYEPSFYIQIEEIINKDLLKIKASNASDSRPLPNVTIAVYEHGVERLISGPQMTDKMGCCIVEVPKGYNECFDIVAEYEGEIRVLTVNRRSLLVKIGDKLGPLGIAVLSVVLAAVLGWMGGRYFERSKKVK